ncbi:MAG: twitching motility protein [Desulfobulbaceae bacterium]|nr:twitching motility protein [Desulfobulbaceae bacterium]
MTLEANQAALIVKTSEEGIIDVEVAYAADTPEDDGFAAAICEVLANKLVDDEEFQEEIMAEVEGDGDEDLD